MWLKICGLTQPQQALAIAQMGVSALGVIGVPQTPRFLSLTQMALLTRTLREAGMGIPVVGVVMDPDWEVVDGMLAGGAVSGLQLHGQESPARCEQIRQRYPESLIIKALRPRSRADLEQGAAYAPWVDALLVDAYHPHLAGGTGQTANWDLLETWDPPCPWMVAGGLNALTLPQALARLQPDGVDLSSGVEVAPGQKNLEQVAAIVALLGGSHRLGKGRAPVTIRNLTC